jgi:hypothetical protein
VSAGEGVVENSDTGKGFACRTGLGIMSWR